MGRPTEREKMSDKMLWVKHEEWDNCWISIASDADILAAAQRIQGATVLPTNSIEDEEFGELLPIVHVEEPGFYLVIPVDVSGDDVRIALREVDKPGEARGG